MYSGGRSEPQQQQQWTVHAEFTIKHDGLEDRTVLPQTRTERDENGVRMVYTWSGPGSSDSQSVKTQSSTSPREPQLPFGGFQRGNLVFTSTPPTKPNPRNPVVPDSSGYSSELLSPISGGVPVYRPAQQQIPYNRRCRSTCSIVLSTDFNPKQEEIGGRECGRTQSLRCQTPTTVKSDRKDSFYGCGDPWCYHSNYGDDSSVRFPPLQECDEYSNSNSNSHSRRPSRASTYTHGSKVKDASVQTFEMIDKCTSPFMRTDFNTDSDAKVKREKNFKKKAAYNARRRTEPVFQRTHSPSSFTPDSLESQQPGRRPDRKQNPETASDPNNKKPRTVHIDVYCTGTEQESSSSCSDSENKTASSPQTVFESGKFRLTRQNASSTELPHRLKKTASNERVGNVSELKKKFEKEDSDVDDGASTAYPSQLSSFSAIKDFGSSLSSVPPSWSTISMSSYPTRDDESVTNTSWKDTYSDLASLLESRSSIAQTDSLDFVPRRLLQTDSIEECPETTQTDPIESSSIQPSDSFEYANSEDRIRIKHMEQMLQQKGKQWKSPHSERKHLLQQRKLKEYLEKRLSDKSLPKWTPPKKDKDSESEGTDSEEKGWSIIKENAKKDDKQKPKIIINNKEKIYEDQGSLSDSSPTSKSPSGIILKHRLSLDPKLGSPFTIVPGIFTEQRGVAEKFGRIVNVFKKPGHHVGPAKNPDCTCEHCRRHFEIFGMRNRARSWGDSTTSTINWKELSKKPSKKEDAA